VSALELVYAHPAWTAVLLIAAGYAVSLVVSAAVEPFAPCRRGNCPRCKGTGAEPLVRTGATP
jgi:hypothetical protein